MINHQNSAAHHFDFSYFYDINIYYFLYYNKNVQKVQQFFTYKLLVLHSITTQVPLPHQNLFEAYLYTEFAPSKTEHEPQGGEPMSAELDERYKRLRRVDGHAWRTEGSGIRSGLSLSM